MTRTRTALALSAALAMLATASAQPPAAPAKSATSPGEDKARELFNAKKFDDALKELQAAAKADPKLDPPRVTLAGWFFQAGQGQLARLNLERAAAEDPQHPAVYLLNGSFAFGEGRVTDAVLNLQTVLQLVANARWDQDQKKRFTREAHNGLARSFETRGDWAAARENLTAILADDPKNGPVRQRLGAAIFRLGKPDAAFAEFQKAYQDDPASDLPELLMATLYGQNEPQKAEEWLKKAVAAHAKDARASRAYAGWLLDSGQTDAAQPYLDAAVRLDPNNQETTALQGLMARYRKNLPAAEKVFEGLYRNHPNYAFAAWNLALVLADSGDKEKQRRAVELAEAEVRKNPRAPEAYAVLGWCYYKTGRLDEAEKAAVTGATAGNLSRDAAYFLARILADRQRWEDAAKTLQAAEKAPGAFVYKSDAQALLAEVEKKAPKKDEKKK